MRPHSPQPPRARSPRSPSRRCSAGPLALGLCLALAAPHVAGQCQREQLRALDPAPSDLLGESLALRGNWMLVGAPSGLPAGQGAGRVLAWRRQAGVWQLDEQLEAADPSLGARFGAAVAMSGNLAVIGAPDDDEAGQDAGAAYVFVRLGDDWFGLDKLVPAAGAAGDGFGAAVAVDGDRIVVGARRHDALGPQSGAAWVFENPVGGSTWHEVARLLASDGAPGDGFGVSVGVDGELVVVGSDLADDGGVSAGVAHVFRHAGGGAFVEEAKLLPDDPAPAAFFGRALVVDGGRVLVAAPGQLAEPADGGAAVPAGAAYAFGEGPPGLWSQTARLVAPAPADGDVFGASLALYGDVALVGASLADGAAPNVGSAHVFRASGLDWVHERQLFAGDAAAGDNFGIAVAVDPPFAVVGAQYEGDTVASAGAAYLYRGLADLDVWSDLGHGLAGSLGEPCAFGEGSLQPDTGFLLSLNGALPGSVCGLVLGAARADLPFKGGTLVPDPLLVVFGLPTFDGTLDLVLPWPAGIPAGLELYVQHMVADPGAPAGFAGSNAVVGVVP